MGVISKLKWGHLSNSTKSWIVVCACTVLIIATVVDPRVFLVTSFTLAGLVIYIYRRQRFLSRGNQPTPGPGPLERTARYEMSSPLDVRGPEGDVRTWEGLVAQPFDAKSGGLARQHEDDWERPVTHPSSPTGGRALPWEVRIYSYYRCYYNIRFAHW
jgi:hypothetical protein